MPAIRNLNSIRCATRNGAREFGRAIAADDLDTRMGLQPSYEQVGVPIRQEINWTMLFEINEYRSVCVALAESHVINTENTWGWASWKRRVLHTTEQGISAGSQPHLCGGTGSSTAAECKAQDFKRA
jgi:hypothetical protein